MLTTASSDEPSALPPIDSRSSLWYPLWIYPLWTVRGRPMSPAMLALLVALSAGEKHGYALAEEVELLTGGRLRLGPGTLYRTLQRMRVEELIRDAGPDVTATRADRRAERRRRYAITPQGRRAARQELAYLRDLLTCAPAARLLDESDER